MGGGVRLWIVRAPDGDECEEYVCYSRVEAERVGADEAEPIEYVARPVADDAALVEKAKERDTMRVALADKAAWLGRYQELKTTLESVTRERDEAVALLREARTAVDLHCGEDVSLNPGYAAELRARIDDYLKKSKGAT